MDCFFSLFENSLQASLSVLGIGAALLLVGVGIGWAVGRSTVRLQRDVLAEMTARHQRFDERRDELRQRRFGSL